MVLYSSTNFRILKPWVIISNLLGFGLGFWHGSKPFYKKLENREKVLEEFQRLSRFPRKVVLYSSNNICILNPWAITSNLLGFSLGFWHGSKPFYRKLKEKEKALEEFQHMPRFPRKIVLYSSTNFCTLNPWAIISNLMKFDLGFWQAFKPFYRKLKYTQKVLEEFQRLHRFPRKNVLYWSTTFCILNPWAIFSNFIRFNLGFWQASKPFYKKLKNRVKVLEEFQCLSHFPRKIVLYSSTNFRILKRSAIICDLIKFDLGFWQASKPFYRKLKYTGKVLQEFQRLRRFPRKMVLYLSTNFCLLNPWNIISNLIRFDLVFWQASKSFYRKLKSKEKVLEEFQRLPRFTRKNVILS